MTVHRGDQDRRLSAGTSDPGGARLCRRLQRPLQCTLHRRKKKYRPLASPKARSSSILLTGGPLLASGRSPFGTHRTRVAPLRRYSVRHSSLAPRRYQNCGSCTTLTAFVSAPVIFCHLLASRWSFRAGLGPAARSRVTPVRQPAGAAADATATDPGSRSKPPAAVKAEVNLPSDAQLSPLPVVTI